MAIIIRIWYRSICWNSFLSIGVLKSSSLIIFKHVRHLGAGWGAGAGTGPEANSGMYDQSSHLIKCPVLTQNQVGNDICFNNILAKQQHLGWYGDCTSVFGTNKATFNNLVCCDVYQQRLAWQPTTVEKFATFFTCDTNKVVLNIHNTFCGRPPNTDTNININNPKWFSSDVSGSEQSPSKSCKISAFTPLPTPPAPSFPSSDVCSDPSYYVCNNKKCKECGRLNPTGSPSDMNLCKNNPSRQQFKNDYSNNLISDCTEILCDNQCSFTTNK